MTEGPGQPASSFAHPPRGGPSPAGDDAGRPGTGTRRGLLRPGQVAVAAVLLAAPAEARNPATPNSVRLRGTIEGVEGDILLVRTREGPVVPVRLRANARVLRVEPFPLAAIAPGDAVEAFALPGAPPRLRAVAVEVRPQGARGRVTADAHLPWDRPPGATRTLSPVVAVEELPDGGRLLDLTHRWGRQLLEVPPGALVVRTRPAGRDALSPGAVVYTAPARDRDRRGLVAVHVTVGTEAVPPPA